MAAAPEGYDPGRMSSPPTQKPPKAPKAPKTHRARRSKAETARTAAMVVLAILITLFAVFNLHEVKVSWIFGSGRAPLIIVIVISLLVGIVLTYAAERIVRKRD
jgi:uncharacterized integral membrane protein